MHTLSGYVGAPHFISNCHCGTLQSYERLEAIQWSSLPQNVGCYENYVIGILGWGRPKQNAVVPNECDTVSVRNRFYLAGINVKSSGHERNKEWIIRLILTTNLDNHFPRNSMWWANNKRTISFCAFSYLAGC